MFSKAVERSHRQAGAFCSFLEIERSCLDFDAVQILGYLEGYLTHKETPTPLGHS